MKKKSKKYAVVTFGIILTVCVVAVCIGIFAGGLRGSNSENVEEPMVEEGVYIPRARPEEPSGKFIKYIEYQGRIYWHKALLGEFSYDVVNECIGTINAENSGITGNVKGDVYSVDGMDTSFMLCVKNKKNYDLYIQDNDITLRTGSDLYDNRTKMKGNIDYAWYWLNGVVFEVPPRLNKEELLKLDRLIDVLCKSPFMYADEYADEKLIEKIYTEEEVCHLVVKTNITAKTQISFNISMVEGGYVFLSGFESVCIKVDDPVFGELMDLLVGPYRREKKSVQTEKAELPFYKNEAGQYVAIDEQYEHAMIDWEGMFVYQGRLYKRSSLNYVEKKKAVGEHLGTATGDIGDDVEFSGNVEGEVYSINGIDPSFMLYVKQKNGSEDVYLSGSDLTLTTGADLYEDLLHLKGNIDFAYCQEKKQEWRKDKECHYEFFRQKLPEDLLEGLELEDFDSFISALCKSPFVYTKDCPFEIDFGKPKQTSGLDVSHMTISTKSGVHLDLILVEGGYVVFSDVSEVCVKVDEAKFNKLFDRIKK